MKTDTKKIKYMSSSRYRGDSHQEAEDKAAYWDIRKTYAPENPELRARLFGDCATATEVASWYAQFCQDWNTQDSTTEWGRENYNARQKDISARQFGKRFSDDSGGISGEVKVAAGKKLTADFYKDSNLDMKLLADNAINKDSKLSQQVEVSREKHHSGLTVLKATSEMPGVTFDVKTKKWTAKRVIFKDNELKTVFDFTFKTRERAEKALSRFNKTNGGLQISDLNRADFEEEWSAEERQPTKTKIVGGNSPLKDIFKVGDNPDKISLTLQSQAREARKARIGPNYKHQKPNPRNWVNRSGITRILNELEKERESFETNEYEGN